VFVYMSIVLFVSSIWPIVGIRAWHFLTHGHTVRKVGGSNPGPDIIVGGVSHPTMQATGKVLNLFIISARGEAVNYRPLN